MCENDDQARAEAAQRTPLRVLQEFEKVISRTRQRHSFHKKRFLRCKRGGAGRYVARDPPRA
jgi:hypothetical protein